MVEWGYTWVSANMAPGGWCGLLHDVIVQLVKNTPKAVKTDLFC